MVSGVGQYWVDGVVYFAGEYDRKNGGLVNLKLVMLIETELRANYRTGAIIEVHDDEYVLTGREVDKKAGMVAYNLKKMAVYAPALDLD